MRCFIANWKEHKNPEEAVFWIKEFTSLIINDQRILEKLKNNELQIIICPQTSLIHPVLESLENLPNIYLGAQNISRFEEGDYTGEISARSVSNMVKFVILGHSERRNLFKEQEEDIEKKIRIAIDHGIEPILCLRGEQDKIYDNVNYIAYEPVWAIGTGNSESIKNVISMKRKLNLNKSVKFIYGGSVNEENAVEYLNSNEIDGFLIATASLDPKKFFQIINRL